MEHESRSDLPAWGRPGYVGGCLYDPKDQKTVFRGVGRRIVIAISTISGLVVAGLVGIIVMLVAFTTCGWRYLWARHAPDDVKQTADVRAQQIVTQDQQSEQSEQGSNPSGDAGP